MGTRRNEEAAMTPDALSRRLYHLEKKPVSLRLRGGRSLEGIIHIPEGLSLLHFLGSKKYFLNLTTVRYIDTAGGQAPIEHLSIRLSNIVWIIPRDATLHISSASIPSESSRTVEIELVDGVRLEVSLNLSDEQRMSDYLDANWAFLPLWSARVSTVSEVVERLAINHEAILSIREIGQS
jgi:hypothetical protein